MCTVQFNFHTHMYYLLIEQHTAHPVYNALFIFVHIMYIQLYSYFLPFYFIFIYFLIN